MIGETLLSVEDICVFFPKRVGHRLQTVRAVDRISFSVAKGETFGLVGESGSGKSTAGDTAIGLQQPTAGRVLFKGDPMPPPNNPKWRQLRRQLQIIFQDPYSSLNPRMTIGQSLTEPLRLHKLATAAESKGEVEHLLELVGLGADMADRHPGALSGGQRQRVGIARALAVQPELIVCDEITSALDVSTQAQIVSLLLDLKDKTNIALIFISHDLGLVRGVADRIGVMYLGQIVESGLTPEVFSNPLHPYTRALIEAAPVPDPDREASRHHKPLEGEIPDPADPPSGCYFRTRCPHATRICAEQAPPVATLDGGHEVSCHHFEQLARERATT